MCVGLGHRIASCFINLDAVMYANIRSKQKCRLIRLKLKHNKEIFIVAFCVFLVLLEVSLFN